MSIFVILNCDPGNMKILKFGAGICRAIQITERTGSSFVTIEIERLDKLLAYRRN